MRYTIEQIQFYGETRYRFWISPSPIGRGYGQSDGSTYRDKRDAIKAAEAEIALYSAKGY